MAKLGFGSVNGEAIKSKMNTFKVVDGKNEIRVFGEIVPRYVYWLKGPQGQIPIECLAFNRETETFDNTEYDHVKDYFPDLKCGWAYAVQGLDANNKPVVFNLKKKLFKQIQDQMNDIGSDPTDLEEGWPVVFTRAKNGPLPYNVEYTFNVLASSKLKGPVTAEQRQAIEEATPLSEILKRDTPEEVKQKLERLKNNVNGDETVDEDVAEELAAQ